VSECVCVQNLPMNESTRSVRYNLEDSVKDIRLSIGMLTLTLTV